MLILNLTLHCVMNIVVPIVPEAKKLIKRHGIWFDTLVEKNINQIKGQTELNELHNKLKVSKN